MAEKKYSVIVTDQAQEQLTSIKLYYIYKLHAKDAALNFVDLMAEVFNDLKSYPKRGRLVDEEPWHSQEIHVKPVKNHLVYYWIDESEKTVWVTAIINDRMDQTKQLKKLKMR